MTVGALVAAHTNHRSVTTSVNYRRYAPGFQAATVTKVNHYTVWVKLPDHHIIKRRMSQVMDR